MHVRTSGQVRTLYNHPVSEADALEEMHAGNGEDVYAGVSHNRTGSKGGRGVDRTRERE